MKHDEKHLPDWADDWVPRKKCPVCKARLVVCNTWGTAVEVCSESGWALEPDLDCHPLSAPPVAPVPPTAESEKLIENAMPEFVVPITRQIHANADDPTDSRKSELREDGPMSQMKWNDGCDALVDFVEEHGGSMGGETRDHLFNIVQNIVDGQSVLETPPRRWAAISVGGDVVCLYCGRGDRDASYPQGTCDECKDLDEQKFPTIKTEGDSWTESWDSRERIICPNCKGDGSNHGHAEDVPEVMSCQKCHANGWVYKGEELASAPVEPVPAPEIVDESHDEGCECRTSRKETAVCNCDESAPVPAPRLWTRKQIHGILDYMTSHTRFAELTSAETVEELANLFEAHEPDGMPREWVETDESLLPAPRREHEVVRSIAQYDPRWTGQRVNDAPSRAQLIAKAFDALAAPLHAPQLEWKLCDGRTKDNCRSGPWAILVGRLDECWLRFDGAYLKACPSIEAAKALAEKLNAVLSPPVGTQE